MACYCQRDSVTCYGYGYWWSHVLCWIHGTVQWSTNIKNDTMPDVGRSEGVCMCMCLGVCVCVVCAPATYIDTINSPLISWMPHVNCYCHVLHVWAVYGVLWKTFSYVLAGRSEPVLHFSTSNCGALTNSAM